jgi:glutaminase
MKPAPFASTVAPAGSAAGRELGIDEAVYASESATGGRNRAIGYLLRNSTVIKDGVGAVPEVYFRQCAIPFCRMWISTSCLLQPRSQAPLHLRRFLPRASGLDSRRRAWDMPGLVGQARSLQGWSSNPC